MEHITVNDVWQYIASQDKWLKGHTYRVIRRTETWYRWFSTGVIWGTLEGRTVGSYLVPGYQPAVLTTSAKNTLLLNPDALKDALLTIPSPYCINPSPAHWFASVSGGDILYDYNDLDGTVFTHDSFEGEVPVYLRHRIADQYYDVTVPTDVTSGTYWLMSVQRTYSEALSWETGAAAIMAPINVTAVASVAHQLTIATSAEAGGEEATDEWPEDRPDDYDEDPVYDPTEEDWSDDPSIIAAGGGRHNDLLVVVGHKKIYFEEY